MNEYRCTRNALYRHNCIGRDDRTVRQGHYIRAETKAQAHAQMCERFPNDGGDFTVDLAKENE